MKKEVLILFILILLPFVGAQNITVNYDPEVIVGYIFPFTLNLSNFEEDLYDVKIDLTANDARVAKILNNGQWKSTYYYIVDAIYPGQEEEFSLNVSEYIGEIDILVRIRDSSGDSIAFEGYEITLVAPEEIEQENISFNNQTNLTENNQTEDPLENESEDVKGENNYPTLNQTNISNNLTTDPPIENQTPPAPMGVLRLNPKVIKSDNVTENLEKSDYAIYGFVVFCVFLAFLFILKKVKSSKNEFKS